MVEGQRLAVGWGSRSSMLHVEERADQRGSGADTARSRWRRRASGEGIPEASARVRCAVEGLAGLLFAQ